MNKLSTYLGRYLTMARMINIRAIVLGLSLGGAISGCIVSAQNRPQPYLPSTEIAIERNSQKVAEVERRIYQIEDEHLDSRIVRLEQVAENNSNMLKLIFVAIFGLVMESLYRIIGQRRNLRRNLAESDEA